MGSSNGYYDVDGMVLYIETEKEQLAVCKKRDDGTLCMSISFQEFGEDYDSEILINKQQAQQIINHLKEQFDL